MYTAARQAAVTSGAGSPARPMSASDAVEGSASGT
jgi:hypothetical protein